MFFFLFPDFKYFLHIANLDRRGAKYTFKVHRLHPFSKMRQLLVTFKYQGEFTLLQISSFLHQHPVMTSFIIHLLDFFTFIVFMVTLS